MHAPVSPSFPILGLDIGPNSIGWALLSAAPDEEGRLVPQGILGLGVRIFEAGTEGDIEKGRDVSRAQARREARLQRRQAWRRARRLHSVFTLLQRADLLPQPAALNPDEPQARHQILAALDRELLARWGARTATLGNVGPVPHLVPYLLRARALDEPLEPYELGRALYHLAQRRGFQSNRKAARNDKEEGKVLQGIGDLEKAIQAAGSRTLGEYFATLDPREQRIRGRWTSRRMYEEEFEQIWAAQRPYYPDLLTDDLKRKLRRALFHQRPLKLQSHRIGGCELEPRRRRAPWALLGAQRLRLLQRVNDLRLKLRDGTERALTPQERDDLIAALETHNELTFAAIRKRLHLDEGVAFNLERGGETKLPGNRTNAALAKIFGKRWLQLTDGERNQVVEDVLTIQKDEILKRRAVREWGLSEEAASQLAELKLEPGYCRFSRKALARLLPHLEQGLPLQTAIQREYRVGRQISAAVASLPPVRKIIPQLNNPAVMRSLTELRRVVNALLRVYGKPAEIRIELARDLKHPRHERVRIWKHNRTLQRTREQARSRILGEELGISEPNRRDIEKLLLWEECGGICPYTGRAISLAALLGPEAQFDVEHIIPRHRSLDDSFLNKTLCEIRENREYKRDRTPFEAYGNTGVKWEQILQRVASFRGDARTEKLRRFQLAGEELEKWLSDFTSRQLNYTRYATRLAIRYLACLYGGTDDGVDPNGKRRVVASRGQITAYLRDALGLNQILGGGATKPREDHRHHAIDALAIALTDARTIKALQDAAAGSPYRHRSVFPKLEPPWQAFLTDATQAVASIVVSHRVDRKIRGRLHEETIYSPPRDEKTGHRSSNGTVVHVRKPLRDLSKDDGERIVDPVVRRLVKEKLNGGEPKEVFQDEANLPHLVARDGRRIPIRKARIRRSASVVALGTGARERHVLPGANHHLEIFEVCDRAGRPRWKGKVVSRLEAYQRARTGQPIVQRDHGPGTRFLFSLVSNPGGDTIELDEPDGSRRLYLVESISRTADGAIQIEFVPLNDARRAAERRELKERHRASLERLRKRNCRKVVVDPIGRVFPAHD